MFPDAAKMTVLLLGIAGLIYVVAAPAAPDYENRTFRDLRSLQGQYVGDPLPDSVSNAELRTLDGGTLKLADLANEDGTGKVVFLNLWATWCGPCQEELPSMLSLATTMATESDRFQMIAIAWDEDPTEVAAFLQQFPELAERVTIAFDPDGAVTRVLGTRLLPETYVVDDRGQIVSRFQSVRDWSSPTAVRLFTGLIRRHR